MTARGKKLTHPCDSLQCRRPRHIPWRREWMAAHSGFLPGEVHEQRSPVNYSSCGRRESDMTERLSNFPEADGNQEVFDFTPSPFSIKGTWILTQAPLVFGPSSWFAGFLNKAILLNKANFSPQYIVSWLLACCAGSSMSLVTASPVASDRSRIRIYWIT